MLVLLAAGRGCDRWWLWGWGGRLWWCCSLLAWWAFVVVTLLGLREVYGGWVGEGEMRRELGRGGGEKRERERERDFRDREPCKEEEKRGD